MKVLLSGFVLLSAFGWAQAQTAVPSLDQDGRKGDMARLAQKKAVEKFDALDKNKDGKLSKEELAEASPYLFSNFERLDQNKDGFLSWEEFIGHNRWKKE